MQGMTGTAQRDASWSERSATLAIFLALGLGVGAWAAAIPSLKSGLGLDAADLSLALLALAVASVVATILTGVVAPRFGTGRSTGLAACATVVAFALPALAQTLLQLVACATAIGFACGALDIAVNGHASDIERRWRTPIMSSFHAAFSLGGLFGASLGGLLAYAGSGVAGQLWVPVGFAAVLAAVATPALGAGARGGAKAGSGFALPERRALIICGIAMFCFLIEGAMADWSAVYLATVAGASTSVAAAGYAAFSVAMAGGRLVGDGVVRALGPGRVMVYGGLIATAGVALALVWPQPVLASIGFAMVGIGASNIVPVVFSAAGRYGSSPSAGVSMVATFGYAGFLGGPPLIGAVATWAGLRVALSLLLVASLLVILGALRVKDSA